MENKLRACFEITQKSIKILIGHCLGEQPFVVYTTEKSIEGLVKDGAIKDRAALSQCLQQYSKVEDGNANVRVSIGEIAIALPPFGLKIYYKDEITTSGAADKKITKSDINTVLNKIKNEEIPGGNELVDIIPTSFVVNGAQSFLNPPIGVVGPTLSMRAMIHTLPKPIALDYPSLANSSGFRVKKSCVAPYCQAQLFATDPTLPNTYILVDLGAKTTNVSIVIGHQPYKTLTCYLGGDALTELIANEFGIPLEKAEELKTKIGYDNRPFLYRPALAKGVDPINGADKKVFQKDLNKVIESYFASFFEKFDVSLASLFDGGTEKDLPIILTGGGSKLNGVSEFFSSHRSKNRILVPHLKIVGGEDPRYSACLGLLIACGHYSGTLEDNYHGVASVSRVEEDLSNEKKDRRAYKKQAPNEDAL